MTSLCITGKANPITERVQVNADLKRLCPIKAKILISTRKLEGKNAKRMILVTKCTFKE